MRILLLAVIALTYLLPAPTSADQPHYYMLLEPGNERWYEGHSTWEPVSYHTLVTHYEGDVSIRKVERLWPYPMTWTEAWHIDATGDVWSCNPDNHSVRTLFLDLPLTPGKTWGEDWGEMGYHLYTVDGEVEVDTCFGTLTCVQVNWRHWDPGYPDEHFGYYRYHDGCGFIEFIYYDGYHIFEHYGVIEAVVGVRDRSWSQIKQLFR